jgi:PKD repeat protein
MVNGSAYDAGGSGLGFVMVRSNGGAWTNTTGTSTWNASLTLASGSNSIEARAWDKAGNPSAVASVTVSYSINPVASFTVSLQDGTTSTVFAFDASACSDLEDPPTALTLRWDWEADGIWDTSWTTDKTALHQFAAPGEYTVKLEVKDTTGLTNSTTRHVTVSAETTGQQALQWWPIAILVAVIVTIVAIMLALLLRRRRKKALLSKKRT